MIKLALLRLHYLGGFPLSRNFYVSRHVNFTRVNKIEAMYRRSCINVKVEPRSPFTFTRGLSYIASISFTHGKITRQWKSTLTVNFHCRVIFTRVKVNLSEVQLLRVHVTFHTLPLFYLRA